MTDELKQRLFRLRDLAPRLNRATDETSATVAMVEKLLADELRLGISAETSEFHSWPAGRDEAGDARTVRQTLAFGRVGGSYRIHVVDTTTTEHGDAPPRVVNRQQTPWPACGRETKLRASEMLPELLDRIIKESERLADAGDETAARLRDMIGDAKEFVGAPAVARDRLICPSCEEPGKLVNIGSSRWGACENCETRWFLDTKDPVGLPEFSARVTTCPSCGAAARLLNVGSSHWGACRDCEVKWPIGVNLIASWRDETEQDWERNGKLLDDYTDAD
jgi:hypothetical protein